LSPRINQQAGTPSAGDLIIKLLKADPAEYNYILPFLKLKIILFLLL
jgi:hypothetical protein